VTTMKTMTTHKNNALYQYIKSFFYFIICCQTVVSVVCVVNIASVGKNTPALVWRIFFFVERVQNWVGMHKYYRI